MKNVILLVDDEEMILNALERVLSETKYTVLRVTSPEAALELLKRKEVHVLISDQRMPNMTGCELLKQVKKAYPKIVTMILSGYADFETIKEAINEGSIYKFISKPWDNSFLKDQVKDAVKHYNAQTALEAQLEKMHFLDKLTGLPNRESFISYISSLEDAARENRHFIALLLIDIDRFGSINNRFGQHIGNHILKAIGERLRARLPPETFLARIGNDEFAILLDQVMHVSQVKPIVQELEKILSEPLTISDREVYVTTSIGATLYPQDSERSDVLIEKAHIALNYCKQVGGGLSQFYDIEMEKQADVNILLETEIHQALKENQFVNFYQPIVSFKMGKIIGAEALVRWQHPRRGLLAPMQFLPLCEQSGLIVSIDKLVFKSGLEDLKIFKKNGAEDLYMTSNFSIRHFMSFGLKDIIEKMVEELNILPQNIIIEVTESVLVHDSSTLQSVLKSIHDIGIRLALDDFGTGYASLSYLKKYPFDLLKIDRSFIREIGRSKNDEVLITSMINMAKSMGQLVIAEGIESQNQIDFLKDKNCDFGQGFIFSHPITKAELIKKLESTEFLKSIKNRIL